MGLLASSLFVANSADAQISLGGNLSYLKFLGSEMKSSHPGIGIRGWYTQSDRFVLSFSANYFLASTEKFPGQYLDGTGNPVDYEMESKTSVLQFDLRGNFYLVGDAEDDFNFYATAGVGVVLVNSSLDIPSEVPDMGASEPESPSGFMMDLGIGAEKNLDFGYLFLETGITFPPFTASSREGATVGTDIASFFQVNAGIRIPLD